MKSEAPVALIRKVAEKLAFEDLTSTSNEVSTENLIRGELMKCADQDLLGTAIFLEANNMFTSGSVDCVLRTYENLGGKYKHAFGSPMFNAQQMAGSPATSGGMAQRSSTTMPAPQQVQPVKSPATASPRAQAQGMTSSPSATAQTPAPSVAPATAPAPTASMG